MNPIQKIFVATFLVVATATLAVAQVLSVGGRAAMSLDRLGCQSGSSPSVDNAALINASMADETQVSTLYVPGKRWLIDEPIVTTGTSRVLAGNGLPRPGSGSSWGGDRGPTSRIIWQPDSIVFDGTPTGAATNDTAVVTVSGGGHTVSASDEFQTLVITGGSNFEPGIYCINSVSGQTWTLDRDCTDADGGDATGLTGFLRGTLIRDQGNGNEYVGLTLEGSLNYINASEPTRRAAILFHQRPYVEGLTPDTGKTLLANCSFENSLVGILSGKGLAEFGDATIFDGQNENHSDHLHVERARFSNCGTCWAIRANQAVGNSAYNWHPQGCDTIFYVERGGKLFARDIFTTGYIHDVDELADIGRADPGPVLLRIGGANASGGVSSPIVIDGGTFDAPSLTMKLLEIDGLGDNAGAIKIRDFKINDPQAGVGDDIWDVEVPWATVKDGWHLILDNVGPLPPGSIKIDNSDGGNYKPSATIQNCRLVGTSGDAEHDDILDTPEIILDPTSTTGMTVLFMGCYHEGYGTKHCRSGLYKIGTGWIWSVPGDGGAHHYTEE